MNVYVVLNPVAGHANVEAICEALARHLGKASISYHVYQTTGEERFADLLESAIERGFDTFVAAGGDGTVSALVDGLVHTRMPLGILPVGTVNALARELGIPLDLDQAVCLLAGEHAVAGIDVGQVNGRCFALNASVGVSVSTMQATRAQDKRRLGVWAYLLSGSRKLMGAQPHRFEIEVDGRVDRYRASEVVVANGGAIGDPVLRWGPDVHLDDGQLDLCVIRARSALDYLVLAWNMFWKSQRRDPRLRCFRIKQSARIDVRGTMPVQADGDVSGETPMQISVLPHAVQMIVPESFVRRS
jgi:YegS/Rv2252/BmrU family lipid kinase